MVDPLLYDHVMKVVKANPDLSKRGIAKLVGCSDSTVRKYLLTGAIDTAPEPDSDAIAEVDAQTLPDSVPLDYMEKVKIGLNESPIVHDMFSERGPVMVMADVHAPLFDPWWFNAALAKAKGMGAKTVVLAGDWWNMDSLSNYYPKQENAGWDTEYKISRALMALILRVFERAILIKGNHDVRVVKRSNYKLSFRQAMYGLFDGVEGIERLEVTNLDHLWVDSPAGMWYICHPTAYNQQPCATASKLADLHHAHVMTAHSHCVGQATSQNGMYHLIETGGLFDKDRTQYLQNSTTYRKWVNGYAWLDVNGRGHLVNEHWES
jgi:predicted phosphodiesterase